MMWKENSIERGQAALDKGKRMDRRDEWRRRNKPEGAEHHPNIKKVREQPGRRKDDRRDEGASQKLSHHRTACRYLLSCFEQHFCAMNPKQSAGEKGELVLDAREGLHAVSLCTA